MTEYIDQAQSLVRDSEKGLRKILSGAATGGAYDDVAILSDVAKVLAGLIDRLNGYAVGDSRIGVANQLTGAPSSSPLPGSGKALHKLANTATPKFLREGDGLVKVAWSKARKAQYEHKAPHHVVDLLVRSILQAGGPNRLVSSDKFLPLLHPEDQEEIPSYQSYVCLAWLVQEGVIGKHGRRGYTVFDAEKVEGQVDRLWSALPTRQVLSRLDNRTG